MQDDIITRLIPAFIALMSFAFAIYQYKRGRNYQYKLAKAQKIFSRSIIKFEFFQTHFKDIIYVGNFPEKSIVSIPFKMIFGNIGDKRVKNSVLYTTYPDFIHESNFDNLESKVKGTFLKKLKCKLVDKSENRHMHAFGFGDINPGEAGELYDTLIISDYNGTDTTTFEFNFDVGKKNPEKETYTTCISFSWVIQFYLRHDDGSDMANCQIRFWNISKNRISEYIESCVNENKYSFEEFIKKSNWVNRIFKIRSKYLWENSIKKTFLYIELELEKKEKDKNLDKNLPLVANDYSLYEGKIIKQKIALVLNGGRFLLFDKEEYEKIHSISHFKIKRLNLS